MRTSSEQGALHLNREGSVQWELHLNMEGSVGTSSEQGGVSGNFI